ncbi:MAG: NifU family protein [Bacteroidota bacterium]|nr:NifU family protein [Bacteroidota bacterium]
MNYSIYAESTPNPEVMKFVANRMLTDKSIEITTLEEAKGISIAEELLKFPFVKSIYLSSNFISVSKTGEIEWENIAMQLRIFIADHLNSNEIKNYTEDITTEKEAIANNINSPVIKEFNASEKEIEAILNEYIAPAVEADGGAITLNYYKNNIVCVNLKGACSGCPSSTSTLKGGIEALLKQKINPDIEVIANEK